VKSAVAPSHARSRGLAIAEGLSRTRLHSSGRESDTRGLRTPPASIPISVIVARLSQCCAAEGGLVSPVPLDVAARALGQVSRGSVGIRRVWRVCERGASGGGGHRARLFDDRACQKHVPGRTLSGQVAALKTDSRFTVTITWPLARTRRLVGGSFPLQRMESSRDRTEAR